MLEKHQHEGRGETAEVTEKIVLWFFSKLLG